MLAHKNFGLPLPINTANPYRVSLGNFITSGLSAPEGALEFLRGEYYIDWLTNALKWLNDRGVNGGYILDETEFPIYKFECYAGEEFINGIKTSEFDVNYKKLTLDVILALLQKRSDAGVMDDKLYQFIDLLKEQLSSYEYNTLVKEYCILCMDRKK